MTIQEMYDTPEFKKLEKEAVIAYLRSQELLKEINNKFPLGQGRVWAISAANKVGPFAYVDT